MIRRNDEIVEDEIWTFGRRIGSTEARDIAQAVFADAYDMMNFIAHGDE